MKEYGGFIGLELAKRVEYFYNIPKTDILRLNCGRSAFYCAVKDGGFKKVYMPYLNCEYSVDPIYDAGAEVEYYFLNEDLTPKDIEPNENEAVLWINYYGNAGEEQKRKVLQAYKNVIIDNCHAFFSQPMSGAYNCYSARKFFGVADGAYLIKENLYGFELEESNSAEDTLFLLKTLELGTNAVYQENLANEERLAKRVTQMAKLTQRILSSIDYDMIQKQRNNNLERLHKNLKDINEFNVNMDSKTHMYYPLLVHQDSMRQKLVEHHIYTPTWWRHVPEQCGCAKLETDLSRYMLMIPIDQRYVEADMDEMTEIIMSCRE